jgi:hypothetical protein
MRNQYKGFCADCGLSVAPKKGYFERRKGRFVVRCMACTVKSKTQTGKPLSFHQQAYKDLNT